MYASPLVLGIVYLGLAGTLLALVIATAQQKWSCKVFFLLALRLAIGWQFLFEGLHKVHSTYTGPTDTNRPFTSEPYFKLAPGPLGKYMREQFGDPNKVIDAKVKAPESISPADFKKLKFEDQAAKCPAAVAAQIDADDMLAKVEAVVKAEAEKEKADIDAQAAKAIKDSEDAEQRALKGAWTRDEIAQIWANAENDRTKARALADGRRAQLRERVSDYQNVSRDVLAALKAQPDGEMLAGQLEAVFKAMRTKAEQELVAATEAEKKAIHDINAAEQRALKGEWTPEEQANLKAKAKAEQEKIKASAEAARKELDESAKKKDGAEKRITKAKADYARWVYGVDSRPTKVKGVTGDVGLTGPQRIEHLEWLRREVKAAEERQAAGLGNGYGMDAKSVAEWRTDLITAESDLAKDANAFIAELKKNLNGGTAIEEPVEQTRGQRMDRMTMWFLVIVGSFLMAGLFTRLSCLLATGFLVMTYLAFPPFPWYPVAPNTEGNPLFINKNLIECFALLALACMPTGRWLGLDALIHRWIFGKEAPTPPVPTT